MLDIDRRSRLIYGRAVPWNTVSTITNRHRAFHRDCLTWSGPVPLLIRHDKSLGSGEAIDFESAEDGLYVTFRVRNGPRGDRALALAEIGWGLSVGLGSIEYTDRGNAAWCDRGELIEVSLVPNPAFP